MSDGLQLLAALTADELAAIAELERAVVEHDGGRLKLEFGALERQRGADVKDLLWWADARLVGFAAIYAFGSATVEVTGMVHPRHRDRGIGSTLLDEVLTCLRDRGVARFLLVTERSSGAARRLAESRGGFFEHSEHALALTKPVTDVGHDETIVLRAATLDDAPHVERILTAAFGHTFGALELDETMVAARDGTVLATLRVAKEPGSWGVYGFGVEPEHQGKGIGRDVLARVCRAANDAGIGRVHLEVSVENDRALGLYTSLGFEHEATEDYFELAVDP